MILFEGVTEVYCDRFSFVIATDDLDSMPFPGPADEWAWDLVKEPRIEAAFEDIPDAALRDELREYGAWEEDELEDRTENIVRILWLAGCERLETKEA